MKDGHEIVAGIVGFMLATIIFFSLFPGVLFEYDKMDRLLQEKEKYLHHEKTSTMWVYNWYATQSCRCHGEKK
jgi:uncharacterized protein YxeA